MIERYGLIGFLSRVVLFLVAVGTVGGYGYWWGLQAAVSKSDVELPRPQCVFTPPDLRAHLILPSGELYELAREPQEMNRPVHGLRTKTDAGNKNG